MYDMSKWSYGVELEYGDCYRFSELPADAGTWNDKDNTCVSSTGIANDPDGKVYAYGGEINTKPSYTIAEQIDFISRINASLKPTPLVNYRSNLHIHVRVPELHNDLESCKKLLRYIDRYQQQAFDIVETIPVPNPNNMSPEEYEWAVKRMKRRQKSHQHKLPKSRLVEMFESKTTQEFFENHAHKDAKGNPAWFQCPRAGINLRQMWEETNTIEFRHFPGTLDMKEMESCIRWCQKFLDAALNHADLSPAEILQADDYNYTFPDFQPYEYETEQIYQWTNFDGNNKRDIVKRIDALRKEINIDDIGVITSKDVYPIMRRLQAEGL
jgi:hypothetical protein